jgi:pyruvate kinase
MDIRNGNAARSAAMIKTKIVATVGPASGSKEVLTELIHAGVDLFRFNFAHADYNWLKNVQNSIYEITAETGIQIGILADLSGPKIRLGILPEGGIRCRHGAIFEFVRKADPDSTHQLTCTYEPLIDDLQPGDRVLLADGTVSMRVIEKDAAAGWVKCQVEQPGIIRSKQGVNLPGVALSTPSVTEKDRRDLKWALDNGLDYIGLSFVRSAEDIQLLRQLIKEHGTKSPPLIVAKIEKVEAVNDLERIVEETDAVMVARGDLGVEADVARVPILQKRIIRLCNQHRIPVITATQMLDSMQKNELPTRAEASDVANAVLDGTDAVMLSGETAVGDYPVQTVAMMSRILHNAERLMQPRQFDDVRSLPRTRATAVTEAVTLGAGTAAEHLDAHLLAVATRGGKTAMALSKQRMSVPILALTDRVEISRRMTLYWGVIPVATTAVTYPPAELLSFVEESGRKMGILESGGKLVLVASSDWSQEGHNLMLVHVLP